MILLLDIEFYISLAVQPTDIKGDKFVIESLGHLLKTPSRLVKASGTPVTENSEKGVPEAFIQKVSTNMFLC